MLSMNLNIGFQVYLIFRSFALTILVLPVYELPVWRRLLLRQSYRKMRCRAMVKQRCYIRMDWMYYIFLSDTDFI